MRRVTIHIVMRLISDVHFHITGSKLAFKTYNYRHCDTSMPLKLYCRYEYTKALYDLSYLGSKTTMTSGEWTCLITFATASLTCS